LSERTTDASGSGLLWLGGILVGTAEWLLLPWKFALLTTGLLLMGLGTLTSLLRRWIRSAPSEAPR
jgi:hypothetical protein